MLKICLVVAYYMVGLSLLPATEHNLRAACHPALTTRQALSSPLVWPITYTASRNLGSQC